MARFGIAQYYGSHTTQDFSGCVATFACVSRGSKGCPPAQPYHNKKTFQNPGTRRERHGRWSPEFGAVITLPRSQSGTSQSGSTGLSCVRVHGEGHKAYHRRGLVFSVSSSLLCLDDTQISTKIGRLTRTAPSLRDMIISLMPRIMKSPILYGRRRHKMCPLSGVGDPVAFGLVVLLSC